MCRLPGGVNGGKYRIFFGKSLLFPKKIQGDAGRDAFPSPFYLAELEPAHSFFVDEGCELGEAAGGVLLTREDLEEGYTLTYNSVTGEAVLSGTLKNTQEWQGVNADGAEVSIIANLKAKSLSSYSVTYDTNGYTVRITLS